MMSFRMYIKAVQRPQSIGVFIRDEMMITMGYVPWIYKKVYLVPGSTLTLNKSDVWRKEAIVQYVP